MASSFTATSTVIDTTGEIVATGAGGGAGSPNELLISVSGGVLIGGTAATCVYPITDTDGHIPINLLAGDELYAKAAATTETIYIVASKGTGL